MGLDDIPDIALDFMQEHWKLAALALLVIGAIVIILKTGMLTQYI